MSQEKFAERIRITEQAIRHEEADRIPIWCQYGNTPFELSGGAVTYRDSMYDHEKAAAEIVKFHQDFQPDAQLANMVSGRVEEIAETAVLDWPGRPGTNVPDHCIYQTLEPELMAEDEYDELFSDLTGFLLHKYIPRAFPGLAGLGKILNPAPTGYMYFGQMRSLMDPDVIDACKKLIEISEANNECQAAIKKLQGTLFGMGFPPLMTGVGLVPYDTLSNYFRHTVDTFEDLMFQPENVERAVNLFADLQIKNLQYFRFADMPVKRVMFWMHKGMDGFMNPEQFERFYWTPFLKVVNALVDMGGALRSGFSIVQAVERVVEDGEGPLAEEFGTLLHQTRVGVPFEEALQNLGERVGSEDLSLVVISVETARRTGGNLAEIFETISATIRERIRIRNRVRTLTAQGRMQGVVLSLMPIGIGVALHFLQPSMFGPFLRSAAGLGTLAAVAVLLVLGALSIRRIVNIDI